MIGALITFLAVLLIVGCFMWIAHSFLKAAEEPGDFFTPEHQDTERQSRQREQPKDSRPQWAH